MSEEPEVTKNTKPWEENSETETYATCGVKLRWLGEVDDNFQRTTTHSEHISQHNKNVPVTYEHQFVG